MCIMNEKKLNDIVNEMIFKLDPVEYIHYMFDRTDENGILYLDEFYKDNTEFDHVEESLRCHVIWNVERRDKLIERFEKLFKFFEMLAQFDEEIEDEETAIRLLKNEKQVRVWKKYLEDFEIGDIDYDRVREIYDKMDTLNEVRMAANDVVEGKTLTDYYKSMLIEYVDITITDEEKRYLDLYREAIFLDSEQRLGKKLCAYEVIIYSRRLAKLIRLNAPPLIINNEARSLAKAMLLNNYGKSLEYVDNSIRLNLEKLELMDDDELDKMFAPKKTNSRKSIAPLFVYFILKNKSNTKVHLRQQQILKELERYPYEVKLERKALSRIIHNLLDSQLCVMMDKSGVWIEQASKLCA